MCEHQNRRGGPDSECQRGVPKMDFRGGVRGVRRTRKKTIFCNFFYLAPWKSPFGPKNAVLLHEMGLCARSAPKNFQGKIFYEKCHFKHGLKLKFQKNPAGVSVVFEGVRFSDLRGGGPPLTPPFAHLWSSSSFSIQIHNSGGLNHVILHGIVDSTLA